MAISLPADLRQLAVALAEQLVAVELDRAGDLGRRRGSRPMMASDVTDLPDPDSPTMPSTSPAATSKLTPRTACTTDAVLATGSSRADR